MFATRKFSCPKRAPDTPKHAPVAPKHAQTHPNISGFDGLASFTCQIARGRTIRAFLVLGRPPPDTPKRVPDTPKQRFCARGPLFSDTHTTTHTRTPAHLRIEVNEKITDFKLRGPSQRHPTHPSHREFAQQLSGCAAQVISTYICQFRSGCRGRRWGMEWGRGGGVIFLAPFQPCKYT